MTERGQILETPLLVKTKPTLARSSFILLYNTIFSRHSIPRNIFHLSTTWILICMSCKCIRLKIFFYRRSDKWFSQRSLQIKDKKLGEFSSLFGIAMCITSHTVHISSISSSIIYLIIQPLVLLFLDYNKYQLNYGVFTIQFISLEIS